MSDIVSLPVLDTNCCTSSFSSYLSKISRIRSLAEEEEFAFAVKYREEGNIEAAHKLILSHLKLVVKIALRYLNYGLPIADLVSEGNLGLMHAVRKYDPGLGYRLSTYAMFWIKCYIHDYILKSWSLVKIGTTAAQKRLFFSLNKIKNKIARLRSSDVDESDHAEIAAALNTTKSDVDQMNIRLYRRDLSLNEPVGSESDSCEIIDCLPSDTINPEQALIESESISIKRKLLNLAIKKLDERESDIFTSRNLSDKPVTLDVLSQRYAISKERIRQIEFKAAKKVKEFIVTNWKRVALV